MQGLIEEDERKLKVQLTVDRFISEMVAISPEFRVFVVVEHPVVKHMGTSRDMQIHEMIGLLTVAMNRLGMLDLDNIRMRLEMTKAKQEQDEAFAATTNISKYQN